jgi:hypothetical protein
MAEYTEIVIDWKYHRSWFSERIDRNKILSKDIIDQNAILDKKGIVYQIYCDSHIYGQDVLAYIGITTDSFKNRFNQHLKSYFSFANSISFRIGIISESDKILLEELDGLKGLEGIESILIANHKPFFNKEYLHYLDKSVLDKKCIIINNGNHGSLKNSCTNFWWVNDKD